MKSLKKKKIKNKLKKINKNNNKKKLIYSSWIDIWLSAGILLSGCPHAMLTEGSATDRLSSDTARLLLLQYLLVELMAARMTLTHHPQTGIKVKMVGKYIINAFII